MKRVLKKTALIILCVCVFLAGVVFSVHAQNNQNKELSLHYYRGVVYFEARRYEQALAEFQAVSAIDPYYKETQKYIKQCISILEEARRDLFKAPAETKAKGIDLYFLGKAHYEKREYRRALEVFKAILDNNPNDTFARYYAQLCERELSGDIYAKRIPLSPEEEMAANIKELEYETAYIKGDIKEQREFEGFLQTKAERKASREALIRKKEWELKKQEELLEEEKSDYLANADIAKRSKKIREETEKWRNLKEKLVSKEPGLPTDLIEYPAYLDKAERYYKTMKESLRTSRWNTAGLNAISSAIYFCDSLLIYYYGIRSAYPAHENISRLLVANVKRSDIDENVAYLHSILNLKKIIDSEDRPITRSEAIFLSEKTEKLAEWCKSILP